MAKTIKFNLICDGKPVRTIENLQNNFSIEDILGYYNNRLLHRWLKVRGYHKELEEVSKINTESLYEIIQQLIHIFNIEMDDVAVKNSLYILQYEKEQEKLYEKYRENGFKVNEIIQGYKKEYDRYVKFIMDNPGDISVIKESIAWIADQYEWILELDYRYLFYKLSKSSKLAVLCLLMNEKTRKYYLGNYDDPEIGLINIDSKVIYNNISKIILSNKASLKKELGDNICTYKGNTKGYWRDLEPHGKKFMILSMGDGDFVRSSGVIGGDLDYEDVLNNFVIIDGVDYKSNNAAHELIYMEV